MQHTEMARTQPSVCRENGNQTPQEVDAADLIHPNPMQEKSKDLCTMCLQLDDLAEASNTFN